MGDLRAPTRSYYDLLAYRSSDLAFLAPSHDGLDRRRSALGCPGLLTEDQLERVVPNGCGPSSGVVLFGHLRNGQLYLGSWPYGGLP